MGEFLGIENSALKFVIAFVLVMALIGLTAWLIRQFSTARPNSPGGARNRQPRLAVLDSAVVDARRRLLLIRRDNVEHLLIIGGPTDVVVEANIVRAQSAAAPQPVAPRPAPQRAPIEPIEPDYDPSLVPFDEPYYEEPAPRPVRERPAPAVRVPAPAAPSPAPRVAPRPAPAAEPRVAPAPAAGPRQTQYADMAQRLEAALRAPMDASARPAPEPRIAPNAPAFAAREEPQLAPPAPAAEPDPKAPGDVFSSLEEEMANLLKPSGGKDPA